MGRFEVLNNSFVYDGEPVRILSGGMHYFRIMPEYWKDRLVKLKALGLNTVETYVPWNLHEPKRGQFYFEGLADITRYIKLAGELGLNVIVRPGPFMCGEWEFGGLPAWLLNEEGIKLRCYNKPYLDRVDAFFDVLMDKLKPLLCTNGGPIIAMQVENEYGSYGNDKEYLEYLKLGMLKRGIDVLLFTSDGPTDLMLQGGTLDGVLKTLNFGSKPEEALKKLREYQSTGPAMCMEFWNGWFDHWGDSEHHTRDTKEAAEVLDEMLELGYSVNLYMFHGGTNFGFYNGANYQEVYEPTITSYDYDSVLTEDGEITPKYNAFKNVISKYKKLEKVDILPQVGKKAYGKVVLTQQQGLFDSLDKLSKPIKSACPLTMEKLSQNFGFTLYRTTVKGVIPSCELDIKGVHDRALIFINGKFIDILYRQEGNKKLTVGFEMEENQLDILVENMGRVNYGQHIFDPKGITENVKIDYQFQHNWTMYPLELNNIDNIVYEGKANKDQPAFYKGEFEIHELKDTFLSLEGWNKGVVYVNGFNLGRYWKVGPQKTLYVPYPILKYGKNEIVVFELHGTEEPVVEFVDNSNLG